MESRDHCFVGVLKWLRGANATKDADLGHCSDSTEDTACKDDADETDSSSDDLCGIQTHAPRTIFHALHHSFGELRRRLPELARKGFDAVQIAPAQACPFGDLRTMWHLRYQPLSYNCIDPALGGESALKALCKEAADLGVMVIADCVFNHMAIVASRDEWELAQQDQTMLEALRSRLDEAFGPDIDQGDFQWPWVCLEGSKWDDPSFMYEGWGCGEWSELRFSQKILDRHIEHLRLLLKCGVRGFRLDAAKHMRPAQVSRYVDFLHGRGAFVYAEVLSLERYVHLQYEELGVGVPTTDYPLSAKMCQAWHQSHDGGTACSRLAAIEPLAHDSIRFVRCHDTVLNDGPPICGIEWAGPEQASLAWAFLLARHDGIVVVYEDEVEFPALQSALAFRSALSNKVAASANGSVKMATIAWPPPSYDLLFNLLTVDGNPVGLTVFNVSSKHVPLELPWNLKGFRAQEVCAQDVWRCVSFKGLMSQMSQLPGRLAPRSARFFLLECTAKLNSTMLVGPQTLTLFYFSGWGSPHLHFSINGHWTSSPGWQLRRSTSEEHPMQLCHQTFGCWWCLDVPLPPGPGNGGLLEFVLNDGDKNWDMDSRTESGNYVAEGEGVYILSFGVLQKCRHVMWT
eukprot:TRINITY_DN72320_c0_g1_i1.p1 TRINITY_DN72320_c0_g1~~TRINITY_DN72320_c0_g1_i1.p1  ORF type:complete len:628 (-),score=86.46 TRINITY_DN72320_c0_g1_i1:252-2135(-)